MKCKLCKGEIEVEENGWDQGNNGQPLVDGRVCNKCNELVILERIKRMRA